MARGANDFKWMELVLASSSTLLWFVVVFDVLGAWFFLGVCVSVVQIATHTHAMEVKVGSRN